MMGMTAKPKVGDGTAWWKDNADVKKSCKKLRGYVRSLYLNSCCVGAGIDVNAKPGNKHLLIALAQLCDTRTHGWDQITMYCWNYFWRRSAYFMVDSGAKLRTVRVRKK